MAIISLHNPTFIPLTCNHQASVSAVKSELKAAQQELQQEQRAHAELQQQLHDAEERALQVGMSVCWRRVCPTTQQA